MTDEEYVRSRWKKAYQYQSLSGVPFIQFGPHALATWSAAAEFTRQREEEIRQLREEIELINQCFPSMGYVMQGGEWVREHCEWSRILTRLASALAALLIGWKGGKALEAIRRNGADDPCPKCGCRIKVLSGDMSIHECERCYHAWKEEGSDDRA